MKTRILSIIIIVIVGALLFSWGTNNAQQTEPVDVDAIRTEAVETYAASLTEELVVLPTAFPTLTVEPSATPTIDVTATLETPAIADPCYKLLWIEDRTIPDGSQMKPNEVFTKTWLIQNNGGCAWAPGFTFSHFGGDPMRGEPVRFTEPIPVGAKREISIELVVPSGINGLIQSSWRMTDENGLFFGDTLSVNIVVGDVTTPTATKAP
ncbi:MAG: NBR1-Ig-like domain-containing protein [Anaerolineales bacterium]|nr:NBR1-Ig-like domain-containing protein [Anaerolineales bacterium]